MVIDPLTNSEVDEEIDITIIDAEKLDREAQKVLEAEKLADKAEKADSKLGGRLSGIFRNRDPNKKLFGLFEEKQELQDKITKLENQMDDITSKIQDITPMLADPAQYVVSRITGKLGPITKLSMIILATLVAYNAVVGFVKGMFEPGSAFDIRKKVLEAAKTIPELNYLINTRNGTIFFTSDTSISQTAPNTSNTERLRDGHMRFNHFHLGDTLGDVV